MQKVCISTISLGLLVAAILVLAPYVAEQEEILLEKPPIKKSYSKNLESTLGENQPDMAYAIVIMPKSYRALLKRFSSHRIAKDIQIIPAKMAWDEGKMIVRPKVDFTTGIETDHKKPNTSPNKITNSKIHQVSGKNKAMDSAIIALFMAAASPKKISFASLP
jgi:hypothetical protein